MHQHTSPRQYFLIFKIQEAETRVLSNWPLPHLLPIAPQCLEWAPITANVDGGGPSSLTIRLVHRRIPMPSWGQVGGFTCEAMMNSQLHFGRSRAVTLGGAGYVRLPQHC
ncbi:hypothetical protein BV22DRAFT_708933 [Leucogyrophana mollusca]|uniref:Uncharacterized protein n=1 Tax=Leucogyrophana mollusca TaxID=85980 RepID=A0ACB8B7P8_9AGAM|nr:hypothetical protein BV22DRAFT_708933 [Leucogyrophana mollusca]